MNIYRDQKSITLALSLLLSNLAFAQTAEAADNLAINNIYIDQANQLVVEFDNQSRIDPSTPIVRDYPGLQHDIVVEFPKTGFVVGKIPPAKTMLDQLSRVFPDVHSIAYATANDGTLARIKLSVSADVSAHPYLAKITQSSATINLDLPKTKTASDNNKTKDTSTIATETKSPAIKPIPKDEPSSPNKSIETTPIIENKQENKSISVNEPPVEKKPATEKIAVDTDTNNPPVTEPVNQTVGEPPSQPIGEPSSKAISEPVSQSVSQPTNEVVKNETAADQAAEDNGHHGMAIKAFHGIKGALHSNKLSKLHNPLPKFGHGKEKEQTEQQEQTANVTATDQTTINTPAREEKTEADTKIASSAMQAEAAPAQPESNRIQPEPEQAAQTEQKNSKISNSLIEPLPTLISPPPEANTPIPTQATNNTAVSSTDAIKSESAPTATVALPPDRTNTPVSPAAPAPVEPTVIPSAPISPVPVTTTASSNETSAPPAPIKEKISEHKSTSAKDNIQLASILPEEKPQETKAQETKTSETGLTETKAAESKPNENVVLKSLKATPGDKNLYPPSKARLTAIEHYNKAVQLHLADKLPEAIAEYKLALVANPKLAEAYSNLGLIYNQQNKYDSAMAEFHKALAINPKDAITYNGIGASLRARNNMPAAVKNWQTAISLDPNLASAHYNLGTAYELQKEYEKALAEYKECLKHDSNLGEAHYRTGLILNKLENKSLAIEEFKQSIKISPQASYAENARRMINQLSLKKAKK